MSIIRDLFFPKKQKFNPRKGSLAHEDFLICIETYMKENNIDWSDLGCEGYKLLEMFEAYKDEEINQIFKKINKDLPDVRLPY